MPCVIPLFLVMIAAYPCALLPKVEEAWGKAEWFRMMYMNVQGQPYTMKPFGTVPITVIEEEEPFFVNGQAYLENAQYIFGRYYIRFVVSKNVEYDLLVHGFRHMNCHAFTPQEACTRIGHGTLDDPIFRMLDTLRRWSYPVEGFVYTPKLMPTAAQ